MKAKILGICLLMVASLALVAPSAFFAVLVMSDQQPTIQRLQHQIIVPYDIQVVTTNGHTSYQYYEYRVPDTGQTLNNATIGELEYQAALLAGCQIVSTSTPALDGTYPLGDTTLIKMNGEQTYIALKGTFTSGQTTEQWLDISGNPHTFPSTSEFTAFGEAMAQYMDALQTALSAAEAGGQWQSPTQPVSIP